MPEIVIYTSQTCGYCQRAKRLLERKGVSYDEIRVDVDADRWREMSSRSGRDAPTLLEGEGLPMERQRRLQLLDVDRAGDELYCRYAVVR